MSIEQKLCEVKIFQLQSMLKAIRCIFQGLLSRILIFRVWPWYWPTIHNSICNICPKFQVISSHFSRLMSIEQKLCEVKIFQLQSMLKAIRCIFQGLLSRILIFRVWPWYSTWAIWVQQFCTAKNGLQVAKYDEWCTVFPLLLIWTNGRVDKAGSRESDDLGSVPNEWWNALPRLGHFAWHWARQCADTRAFYIAALYNFPPLGFRQWRSRADIVVNLNTTIRLPLFWRTWTRARASTRPHVLAWHMGRDYSYCRASELTDCQVSGFVFSWFLENSEKAKA